MQATVDLTRNEALAEAEKRRLARDFAAAEALLRPLLAESPDDAEALHLAALIADGRGETEAALPLLERACAADRAFPMHHRNLAELYRHAGRAEAAEASARRAVALDPGLVLGWDTLGRILIERGGLHGALAAFEQVVALQPGFSGGHNNLGVVLQQLGRIDAARLAYTQALAQDPENASLHANLASALARLGRYQEALESAKSAIALGPPQLNAYLVAAEIEHELKRYAESLDWLIAARTHWPDHSMVIQRQAGLLLKLRRFAEGLALCGEQIAKNVDAGNAYNIMGLLLRELGRHEEAMAAFEAGIAIPPPASAIHSNRAVLLMELGHPQAALSAFDEALAIEPDLVDAWYGKSDIKRFAAGDPELGALERLLARTESHRDRLTLHFALGKAYLDHADGDQAFAHFAAGNRMKRDWVEYEEDWTESFTRSIMRVCSADLLERLAGHGAGSDQPVFIVGMPRSGTTLIEQILASHPQIEGAGEPNLMRDLARHNAAREGRPDSYPAFLETLAPERLAQIGEHYLADLAALVPPADRIVDKMPTNFLYLGLIRLILPNARIIHCRRDPLDTCLSCYTKLFSGELDFSYDQAELGRYYRRYERLMAHWRTVLPPGTLCEIDYERVVDDLEGETRRLLDFCGLGWDPACLKFHETRRTVSSASVNQVRQPLYRNAVGRAQPYRRFLGELIEALG